MPTSIWRWRSSASYPSTTTTSSTFWTVITVWECELSKKNLDATITRIEADLQTAKTKYEHYLSIRRENREFARKQAQKHREILAQVEAELNLSKSLRHYATKAMHEE